MNQHGQTADHNPLPGRVALALLAACLWLSACSGAAPEPLASPTPGRESSDAPPTPAPSSKAPTATSWSPVAPVRSYHPTSTPVPTATHWTPKTPAPRAPGPTPLGTAEPASYGLDCRDGYHALVDETTDEVLTVSRIPATLGDCYGVWTEDRRRVLIRSSGAWYIWTMGEDSPYFVLRNDAAYRNVTSEAKWSPSGVRLAMLWEGKAWVFDSESQELFKFALRGLARGAQCDHAVDADHCLWEERFPFLVNWYTDDVVSVMYANVFEENVGYEYYEAHSGKLLVYDPYCCRDATRSLSPDGRWWAVWYDGPYVVYDLREGRTTVLSSDGGNDLRFLFWSEESAQLYFVSRPLSPSAVSDPNTPFGLLSYNPVTDKVTMLFEQAIEASFSPDRHWALVAFPSRQQDGHLPLAAGLWRVGTSDLVGQQTLADEMVYPVPLSMQETTFLEPSKIIDAEWAEDGRRVRFKLSKGGMYHDLVVPTP